MSITVVARRTGYPGLETALLAAMVHRMLQATPQHEAMQTAGLFQCITAPTEVLYIAEWESREAHAARVQENRVDELLAPLSAGDPVRYFLHRWVSYEIPGARPGAVDCAIINSTPARRESLHAFLLRKAAIEVRAEPGFCYRRIYRDLDHPDRLVVVHGWTSPAAMQAFLRKLQPSLDTELHALGVTVESFIGVMHTEMMGQTAPSTA